MLLNFIYNLLCYLKDKHAKTLKDLQKQDSQFPCVASKRKKALKARC